MNPNRQFNTSGQRKKFCYLNFDFSDSDDYSKKLHEKEQHSLNTKINEFFTKISDHIEPQVT